MSGSRFMAVLETSYPDLVKALADMDGIVGNREVEVLQALCASNDEAERLNAAMRGATGDLTGIFQDFEGNSRVDAKRAQIQFNVHTVSLLLRMIELGVWLGQERLMSLKPAPLRHRLKILEDEARKKAAEKKAP
jgi:hypothetical protein